VKNLLMKFCKDDPWNQWNCPFDTPAFASALLNFGWTATEDGSREHDLVFDTLSLLAHDPPTSPTVVFIRADQSWPMPDGEHWDRDEHVLGFVLPLVTTDPESSISRDVFVHPGVEIRKPVRALTGLLWEHLAKCPFYRQDISEKTLDVVFIGTMQQGGNVFINLHRSLLRKAWSQLDDYSSVAVFVGMSPIGYVMNWEKAWEVIKTAKVVVSPWGICEISWRDYEAVLGACMIVKPRQPEFLVTSNPWREFNTVYCEPDFSDLCEAVKRSIWLHGERKEDLLKMRDEFLKDGADLSHLASAAATVFDFFVERI